MSTVHVFVGQCGTQLGTNFLDELAHQAECSSSDFYQQLISSRHFRSAVHRNNKSCKKLVSSSANRYVNDIKLQQHNHFMQCQPRQLPQPRCVMVDMQPKVIQQAIKRVNNSVSFHNDVHHKQNAIRSQSSLCQQIRFLHNSQQIQGDTCNSKTIYNSNTVNDSGMQKQQVNNYSYTLAPQQCVTRGEGSGNNWAFGYHEQGESRRQAILQCLRSESEQNDDRISCFHVLHAVAGGTGSGVGSLVAQVIKDNFPSALLLHTLVWPFTTGEVVTQWYNLVLAMQSLQQCVDGACVLYNDEARRVIMSKLATRGLQQTAWVDYNNMNDFLSQILTPLHLPQQRYSIKNSTSSNCQPFSKLRLARMSDVIEAVSLDPASKFFCAKSIPETDIGGMSWSAIIQSAARTATSFHTLTPLSLSSSSLLSQSHFACNMSSMSYAQDITNNTHSRQQMETSELLFKQYSYRRCLWTLRGPGALTDGLHELHRIWAEYEYNTKYSNNNNYYYYYKQHYEQIATRQQKVQQTSSLLFPLTTLFVSPCDTSSMQSNATDQLNKQKVNAQYQQQEMCFVKNNKKNNNKKWHDAQSTVHQSCVKYHVSDHYNSCDGKADNQKYVFKLQQSSVMLPQSHTQVRDVARERRSVHIIRPTRQAVLYGPTQHFGQQCTYALNKAEKLLHVNAYLHHYERYGVSKQDLLDACATLWDVTANYTNINAIS